MLAKLFASVAVTIGLLLLLISLRPIYRISRTDKHWGWVVLIFLLSFFILTYALFDVHLFSQQRIDISRIFFSTLLLGGAIFVILVVRLSQHSIERNNQTAKLERYNSFHDDLTGLGNRKSIIEALTLNIEKQQPFALLLVDLNSFKQINDGLGHYFGDNFLVAVAKRLNETAGDVAHLYRMGGDEFAIWVQESDIELINQFVEQIHRSLDSPVIVNNYPIKTSVNIGITRYPDNGDEVFALLKQADLAMYESKEKQTKCSYYRNELGTQSFERMNLLLELSEAIRYSEFELYYQPIVTANDGVMTSYEVLIRWPQSTGGFIPPDKFIPVAEKSSLITALTQWVINQAVMDLYRLRQRGFSGSLHINLSAKDLLSHDLVNQLDSLMASGRLQAGDFVFEITEGAMFEDMERAKQVMLEINQRGFNFSIDDFGTGFSSMLLLRELPVEQIKIDRSFVMGFFENETNRSIVYSVLNLARDLNCTTVAEGVETAEMQDKLYELGCTYLQGYYFSKPLPLSKIHYSAHNSEQQA